LAVDQKVGTVVWSPLADGRLTGKVRRNQPLPAGSRLSAAGSGAQTAQSGNDEALYRTIDVMDAIVHETGKSHAQIALNWLLQRPTVCTLIFGARNETQLRENMGAVGWKLTAEQVAKLDAASATAMIYPYWHQRGFERNPFPVTVS